MAIKFDFLSKYVILSLPHPKNTMLRHHPLSTDNIYHIYSRSIAKFTIFRSYADYDRLIAAARFYKIKPRHKFSEQRSNNQPNNKQRPDQPAVQFVDILAYCLMPTHFHFIIKQTYESGISIFMQHILGSYSHYFNIKYNRRGPLWERRFQNKLIHDDQQLKVCARYLHLNPVKAGLVNKPHEWLHSSFIESITMNLPMPYLTQNVTEDFVVSIKKSGVNKINCDEIKNPQLTNLGSYLDLTPKEYELYVMGDAMSEIESQTQEDLSFEED